MDNNNNNSNQSQNTELSDLRTIETHLKYELMDVAKVIGLTVEREDQETSDTLRVLYDSISKELEAVQKEITEYEKKITELNNKKKESEGEHSEPFRRWCEANGYDKENITAAEVSNYIADILSGLHIMVCDKDYLSNQIFHLIQRTQRRDRFQ